MKKFLALYLGSAQPQQPPIQIDDQTRDRGVAAWGSWVAQHQANILDLGGPLGATKKASAAGLEDTRNAVAAYVIVQAESHEAAVRMFEGHPHFTIFPGDSVEVMECLPIPGR